MALRLELSTSDSFDEDYLEGRQRAEQAALDDWWASQLTPPQAPPETPAGPGPEATPAPAAPIPLPPRPTAPPVSERAYTPPDFGPPPRQEAPTGLTAKVGTVFREAGTALAGGAIEGLTGAIERLQRTGQALTGLGTGQPARGLITPGMAAGVQEPDIAAAIPQPVPPNETGPGLVARGLVNMGTQVLGLTAALGAGLPEQAVIQAILDLTADPSEGTLTDLVLRMAPELKNTPILGDIAAFFATDPTDSAALAKVKKVIEGQIVNAGFMAAFNPRATVEAIGDALDTLRQSKTVAALAQPLRGEAGAIDFGGQAPKPPAPRVADVPVSELHLDPQRFQYKVQQGEGGSTGSLAAVQTYDPELAGLIQVWRDPADGQTYVVNGHNRVDLAKRTGADTVTVRYLDYPTAEEARTRGALTNIAEGRGSAIDAAKFFRDTGLTTADLQAMGIPLRERIAADGLALANLDDSLFQQVVQGTLPLERAIVIGSRISDPDQQRQLVELLRQQGRVNVDTVREYADFVQHAPTQQVIQDTLFGAEETTQSLARDKFRLAAAIRDQLSKDKTLFGRISKQPAAERLTEAGNVINVEESQRIAQESERLLNLFDRLKYRTGPIGDILNTAAEELRAGGNFNDVRQRTYQRLSEALPEAIRGAETADAGRAAAGLSAGEFTTSTGDQLIADVPRTRGAVSAAGVPIREQPASVEPQASIFDRPPGDIPSGTPPGTPPGGPPLPPGEGGGSPPGEPPRDYMAEAFESPGRFNPAYSAVRKVRELTAEMNVAARESGLMEVQTRGSQTLADIEAAARRLVKNRQMTVESILAFEPGTVLSPEEATAARFVRDATIQRYEQIMRAAQAGDEQALAEVSSAFLIASRVEANTEAASGTEFARGLAARRIASRPRGRIMDEITHLIETMKGEAITPENTAALQQAGAAIRGTVAQAKEGASRRATAALSRIEKDLAATPAEGHPAETVAVLWQSLLDGLKRERKFLDPDLLLKVMTTVQDQINTALPEGQLLAGLYGDFLKTVTTEAPQINPNVLMALYQDFTETYQKKAMLDYFGNVRAPKRIMNALVQAWVQGLLTAPPTHMANIASNTLTTFWAIPERMLAARLGPDTGTPVMRGEGVQLLYGAMTEFTGALRAAKEAFVRGESAFGGPAKQDFLDHISAEALGLSGPLGRAIDFLGRVSGGAGRLLTTEDEFFKVWNYRMELRAQALRAGVRGGLEGPALDTFIKETIRHPWKGIDDAAREFAFYQTFNAELGDFGQALLALRQSHPSMTLVLPFIRTPANLFKYGLERMPGLNFMLQNVKDDLAKPGARRDLALAKMSLGGLIMGTVAVLTGAGLISGDGPQNPTLKKHAKELLGETPYSFHFPGEDISYNRLDPIGHMIGTAATIAELSGELPEAELDQLAMAAVLATMESITSKTYLTGVSNVLDAVTSPEDKGLKYLRSMARSVVPAGVGAVNRAFFDQTVREVNGLVDEIKARIPIASWSLYPHRNLKGEAVRYPVGWGPDLVSPVYSSERKDDPVAQEIKKQRVSLAMPPKFLAGRKPPSSPFAERDRPAYGIPLSPAEYDLYVRLAGHEWKSPTDGLGMWDKLGQVIQSPEYQRLSDGPDGSKAILIRGIVSAYREAAGKELLRRSEAGDGVLFGLYKSRMVERGQAQMPPPSVSGETDAGALSRSLGR